ncbi:MAG: GRAS family protein, partial [Spirochaetes bacterium]|nr:GRAS family protein [Spirochaetota bacterium]
VSDYLRTEPHESSGSWLMRFARSGFKPYSYEDIKIDMPDYCEYQIKNGVVELGFQSTTLISVFAYQT